MNTNSLAIIEQYKYNEKNNYKHIINILQMKHTYTMLNNTKYVQLCNTLARVRTVTRLP